MDSTPSTGNAPARAGEARGEVRHLREVSSKQWRSGIAAWLGWTFDGLDMHLYTLVATPFVAQLLGNLPTTDERVAHYSSIIQGAFLLGWALGGGFFGRIGDRLGRARALSLTVLTYALFTGLSFFATTWWHLLIFRFLAALGIGGEWAVGACLLSETWPTRWRPWIAAILQSGVNIGILVAILANTVLASAPPKFLFLVGVLPALLVFWIRRAVPEPEEWRDARKAAVEVPGVRELFSPDLRGKTIWVLLVCGISLTGHWAFMFWYPQHLRILPEVLAWSPTEKNQLVNTAMYLVIASSIAGNFFGGWLARLIGYRGAIVGMLIAYFLFMLGAYAVPRDHHALLYWFPWIGFCQGTFALFTMYLPPLFPTLLRTTGAGFSYNIGRTIAAVGVVTLGFSSKLDFFGMKFQVGDYRPALLFAGLLFLPAAFISLQLPRVKD